MIGACSFQPVSASCSLPIYTPAAPPCRPGFAQLSPLDLLIFRPSLVLKRGFETSKRDQVVFPVLDAKYVTQNAQNVLLTMSSVCICVFVCVCIGLIVWKLASVSVCICVCVRVSTSTCLVGNSHWSVFVFECFIWLGPLICLCPCLCQCVSHQCVFVFSSEFVCLHCPAWLRPLICQGRISDNRD